MKASVFGRFEIGYILWLGPVDQQACNTVREAILKFYLDSIDSV